MPNRTNKDLICGLQDQISNLERILTLEETESKKIDTISSKIKTEVVKTNLINTILFSILIIISITISSVYVYWKFFEEDPVEITYVPGTNSWSACKDREYVFTRLVKSTRDIKVEVFERYYDKDGMSNFGNIENEYHGVSSINYPVTKGEHVFTFEKKVPRRLDVGIYEYRPIIQYEVNPVWTATKKLPIQNVIINCTEEDYIKRRGLNGDLINR